MNQRKLDENKGIFILFQVSWRGSALRQRWGGGAEGLKETGRAGARWNREPSEGTHGSQRLNRPQTFSSPRFLISPPAFSLN